MDQQTRDYEVSGAVRGRNGDPLRSARVVVWWQQIRDRKVLAAGEASEQGRYRLRYRVPENAPQPLLLVVEALSEYLDAPLFSSVTNAQPTLEIDLNFEPPDQSEWATLVRLIEPFLGGLALAGLEHHSPRRFLPCDRVEQERRSHNEGGAFGPARNGVQDSSACILCFSPAAGPGGSPKPAARCQPEFRAD
jgi:hypothetical protein